MMHPEPDKSSLHLKQKKIIKKPIFNYRIKRKIKKREGIKVRKY